MNYGIDFCYLLSQKAAEISNVESRHLLSQKAAEIADVESRHRRELEAIQKQLMEAKKQAESREAELRKEIDSLKRIIADLQDKLGMF